jgi:protein SCO1/2
MSRKIIFIVLVVTLFGIGSISLLLPKNIPLELKGILWPEPKPLQAFNLIDHHKQPFNLERLKNKWTFLFFGYTSCPDICPTSMVTLQAVYERLKQTPEVALETQVIFVSVDPERDTLEQLSNYVEYFHKDFLGITNTVEEEINKFSRQFYALYKKEPVDASGNYLVTHTSSFFLIDPQMRLYARFSQPHIPETIVDQYFKIRSIN